ncbi:MAG: DUF6178 family protein [Desulfobacter sp.]
MTDTPNYKLDNMARKALKRREQRGEILSSEPEKALDMILEAPSPATLVQSFPDQDLYYLMHRIGVHDFAPVLAMASSTQWEYILDVEVWDDDRLDTGMMAQAFAQLFKADPQRLLRWSISEKPDFLEFFLFHNMQVHIREHDEPPPSDFEDYTTLDDKFYFRFPDKSPDPSPDGENGEEILPQTPPREHAPFEDTPELIENMLKSLAEMDLSVFHGLLLETLALMPSESEEEQFRLRNLRLAEKGFLPPHEAVGIYQPSRFSDLRKRPGNGSTTPVYDPETPLPPQFFAGFITGDSLFVNALAQVDDQERHLELQNELAALINKIISADKIKIRNRESVENTMEKANAFLSLGLEVLLDGEIHTGKAAQLLRTYFLEDIFRTGSGAGIQLKIRAGQWYRNSFLEKNNLPLSFLGEAYLGVVGGLLIQRPMFFSNYADKELYRHFSALQDIRSTERLLEEIMDLDGFLGGLPIDMETFTQGVLTYKSVILTLWVRDRLGLQLDEADALLSLAPVPMDGFRQFFTDLFQGDTGIAEDRAGNLGLWAAEISGRTPQDLSPSFQAVLYALVRELEEEYGHVKPEGLDPRFIPHILLETD